MLLHKYACAVVLVLSISRAYCAIGSPELSDQLLQLKKKLVYIKDDVIAVNKMQDIFDDAVFNKYSVKGVQKIDELASHIADGFEERFNAVRKNRNIIHSLYENQTIYEADSNMEQCCNLSTGDLEPDPKYLGQPVANRACIRISERSLPGVLIPNSHKIVDVFQENRADMHFLKWQYLGTEEGVTISFPARPDQTGCGAYDPRYRPWYAQVSTSIPKDIVLVIDRSQSMNTGNRLNISKEAAKTVIETLNPNDRVAVVLFSDRIKTPDGRGENCYGTELAYATPYVIDFLSAFINDYTASGSTSYINGLDKAFSYFQEDENRNKVILFLTDGKHGQGETKRTVLEKLSELNARQSNSVLILTYGLAYNDTDGLLTDMATMVRHDASKGQLVIVGKFTHISNDDDLRYQLASYYSYFAAPDIDQPVVTVPYVDYSLLGHIFSICLPIVLTTDDTSTLKGSTCIDMTLADITNEFEYLQRSNNAYVFIIDTKGRTILHPMLPIPGNDYRSDPLFVDIDYFEHDAKIHGILDSMKRHEDGNKTIQTTIITNRGAAKLHGVNSERRPASYIWRGVRGTHFSVCIVLTDNDVDLTIETADFPDSFLYHQFNIEGDIADDCSISTLCLNRGVTSTLDNVAVQLSADAFQSSSTYPDDCTLINCLSDYMAGVRLDPCVPIRLNEGIREMYAVISKIIPEWTTKTDQAYNTVIYERFLASRNGIFTVYPGTRMSDSYDHTLTDWYNTAISHKDRLVFTPPRNNEFGRCGAVTIAHTLLEGRQTAHELDNDLTIAVIGINIPASFIRTLILQHVPTCANKNIKCMLIDTNGFFIYHPEISTKYKHLAQLEPDIAYDLISKQKMLTNKCNDFAWKLQYNTWTIVMDTAITTNFYYLEPLGRSNVFLVIRDTSVFVSPQTCDSCPEVSYKQSNGTLGCHRLGPGVCNCPCHSLLGYESCENSFRTLNDESDTIDPVCANIIHTHDTCIPYPDSCVRNANSCPTSDDSSQHGALPQCYAICCDSYTNVFECEFRIECAWCVSSNSDVHQCRNRDQCMRGNGRSPPNKGSNNTGSIIGAVIACLLVVAFIVVIVVLFRKYKQLPKFIPDNNHYEPNDNPIYDELHDVTPHIIRNQVSSTSTTTTSVPSLTPQPVGFINTAFQQQSSADSRNLNSSAFNRYQSSSGDSHQSDVVYSGVITDQYLTPKDVRNSHFGDTPPGNHVAGNADTPVSSNSSQSYHGSFAQHEPNGLNSQQRDFHTHQSHDSALSGNKQPNSIGLPHSKEPGYSHGPPVHVSPHGEHPSLGRYVEPDFNQDPLAVDRYDHYIPDSSNNYIQDPTVNAQIHANAPRPQPRARRPHNFEAMNTHKSPRPHSQLHPNSLQQDSYLPMTRRSSGDLLQNRPSSTPLSDVRDGGTTPLNERTTPLNERTTPLNERITPSYQGPLPPLPLPNTHLDRYTPNGYPPSDFEGVPNTQTDNAQHAVLNQRDNLHIQYPVPNHNNVHAQYPVPDHNNVHAQYPVPDQMNNLHNQYPVPNQRNNVHTQYPHSNQRHHAQTPEQQHSVEFTNNRRMTGNNGPIQRHHSDENLDHHHNAVDPPFHSMPQFTREPEMHYEGSSGAGSRPNSLPIRSQPYFVRSDPMPDENSDYGESSRGSLFANYI